MDDLLLLSEAQMRRIEPYLPLSHGIARIVEACLSDAGLRGPYRDAVPIDAVVRTVVDLGRARLWDRHVGHRIGPASCWQPLR